MKCNDAPSKSALEAAKAFLEVGVLREREGIKNTHSDAYEALMRVIARELDRMHKKDREP